MVTDNGPQFACTQFAKAWQFKHRTISPGNSKVESVVKKAKTLLQKASDSGNDPYLALSDRRNTPTQDMDTSPASFEQKNEDPSPHYERTSTATSTQHQPAEATANKKPAKTSKLL